MPALLGEVELSSGHAVAIDNVKYAFALARAVDLLRKSAEPGEPQKAALRALVGAAAERSATFRFYDSVLTIDNEPIATTDPRLTPFAERLTAQQVAEVVIARGADPGELLALATGLAQDPNQGRIKERLRDAGSSRVMVVLHSPDTGHRPPQRHRRVRQGQARPGGDGRVEQVPRPGRQDGHRPAGGPGDRGAIGRRGCERPAGREADQL